MKNDASKGFTLIELMVAIGLFATVMTIAAGAYLTIIHANQQAQAIASGIDNVSFALDSMTRSIRSGSTYGCPTQGKDCYPTPGPTFAFKDVYGTPITYTFDSSSRSIQEMKNNDGVWITLTDPSVHITSLEFYVSGTQSYSTSGDILQPYVTIVVSGFAGPVNTKSFTVESSAAWRGSDK
ncbi:MAG: PilW family protein [Minisyncoccota bacterium]